MDPQQSKKQGGDTVSEFVIMTNKRLPKVTPKPVVIQDMRLREFCRRVMCGEAVNVVYQIKGGYNPRQCEIMAKRARRFIGSHGWPLVVTQNGNFVEIRKRKREARPLPTA
jgi:hypothetical protein